jgi:hypothetical protein
VHEPLTSSLYVELAEPAPEEEGSGQTITTKAKETVDNDVEAVLLDMLVDSA